MVQIGIPQPCHENWEGMSPREKGRFCNACSKVVRDFTQMPDMEIVATVLQPDSQVCGRIGHGQLQRINTQVLPQLARRAAMLALLGTSGLSFLTGNAMAQNGVSVELHNQVAQQQVKVAGRVTALETGQPLVGYHAVLNIAGMDRYSAITDSNGRFEMEIDKGEGTLGLFIIGDSAQYETASLYDLPWNDQHHDIALGKAKDNLQVLQTGQHYDIAGAERRVINTSLNGIINLESIDALPVNEYRGMVREKKSKEPIPFASIVLKDANGKMVGGTVADIEGNYAFEGLPEYASIEVSCVGYESLVMEQLPSDGKLEINENIFVETVGMMYIVNTNFIYLDPPGTTTFTQDDIKFIIR
ncbi:MAG: carboxypeptidase-like regulatory domain-containing protein [Chitinophagales bacterium]|nr:carboxypeptidase-like regulatory domain-containing protein [Chitinophagales bacterium]